MPFYADTLHTDLRSVKDKLFTLQTRFRSAVNDVELHPQDWQSAEVRLAFMAEDAEMILAKIREMQSILHSAARKAA
jgi:hypothetical protein